MMRRLDTLIGRTMLVSLIGISLMHVVSLWSYELALKHEVTAANEARLAERLLSIRSSLAVVPTAVRDDAAHKLSGGLLEVHWSSAEKMFSGRAGAGEWAGLASRLRELAPEIGVSDVRVGAPGESTDDPHVTLVSLKLPDDSWVHASLYAYGRTHAAAHDASHGTLLSTTLMAIGVIIVSIIIAGWLTRPIRNMAAAVRALHPGDAATRLPETGPGEMRDLAVAFNEMQERIHSLIWERTRALAAVSHDLRTPLTRLRLRLEDIGQPELSKAVSADIGDLEQMIDATLSYLKGEETVEPQRALDLTALIETIVDAASDLGQDVTSSVPRKVHVRGRSIGLKRAFSNLIQNAVKYGVRARLSAEIDEGRVVVHIDDDGPGIPADKLRSVLEPFVRLEPSRSRETGGVGLGLTIAKANVEADQGSLTLSNRDGGGLRVSVMLPLIS